MPSDINLLQNQLTADSTIKFKGILEKVEAIIFAAIILSVLVGAGLIIWNGVSKRNQVRTAEQIEQRKVELASTASVKRNEVVRTQAQIANIEKILPEHVYWSEVFKLINNSTLAGIQLTQVSASSKDGRVLIMGQASEFNTVAAFAKKLGAAPGVTQAIINSSSLAETSTRILHTFAISATVDKSIFEFPKEE